MSVCKKIQKLACNFCKVNKMAEKYLNIIFQFTAQEFLDFLRKNGCNDFAEILTENNITDVEKILNLTELDFLKWKLPLSNRRKFLNFLNDLKTNPQKYVQVDAVKTSTLTRKESSMSDNNEFKSKLEKVIINPKFSNTFKIQTSEAVPKPYDTRTFENESVSSLPPPDGYLPMDLHNKEKSSDFYDPEGYLISKPRPPLAPPLDEYIDVNNDESDKVSDYEEIEEKVKPKEQLSVKNVLCRSHSKSDSKSSELKKSVKNEPQPQRKFSLIRRTNSTLSNISSRPLPPLPPQTENIDDEPPTFYANTLEDEWKKQIIINEKKNSKSDLREPETTFYGNIEEPKPQSYEKHFLKSPKFGAGRPLPLPPSSLPPINIQDLLTEDISSKNLNDYPFYRNTDRKGVKILLDDLENGSFVIRPSKKFFLTLTLKHNNHYFNFGIEKIEKKLRLNTEQETSITFTSVHELVEHFTREPFTFYDNDKLQEVFFKKSLPEDRF